MSIKYVTDRALPDKAIDLIDEAASRVRIRARKMPDELRNMKILEETAHREKELANRDKNYELAAEKYAVETQARKNIDVMEAEWKLSLSKNDAEVKREDIAEVDSRSLFLHYYT